MTQLPDDCGDLFALLDLRGALLPVEDLAPIMEALKRAVPASTTWRTGKSGPVLCLDAVQNPRIEITTHTRQDYANAVAEAAGLIPETPST